MDYYHEQVKTDTRIPAKIYVDMAAEKRHYFLHFHDNLEFDLLVEGAMTCVCNSITTKLTSGNFFFVNSGDLHETKADSTKRVKTVTVLLSYDLLKKYCPDIQKYTFSIPEDSALNSGTSVTPRAKIKALITSIGSMYREQKPYYELEITSALEAICLILLRECKVQKTESNTAATSDQKSFSKIKAELAYLEANYSEDISLGAAASQIDMVPSYFSRFFKKATNEPFYNYLMKLRSYHAYHELMETDRLITDIALDNGFLNVKAFIDSFKKIYGDTPAKYRRSHEGE